MGIRMWICEGMANTLSGKNEIGKPNRVKALTPPGLAERLLLYPSVKVYETLAVSHA
jgi:hypothetical protein